MKTKPTVRQRPKPVTVAMLATSAIAPVFGALYAGWTGAIIAFLAWSCLVTWPRLFKDPSRPANANTPSRPHPTGVLATPHMPAVSVTGEAIGLLLRAVIRVLGLFTALARLVGALTQPKELPQTMVNLTLAIILATCVAGIDAAFYAALVGVPIVILTLIVVAFEPSIEPQPAVAAVTPKAHLDEIEAAA